MSAFQLIAYVHECHDSQKLLFNVQNNKEMFVKTLSLMRQSN